MKSEIWQVRQSSTRKTVYVITSSCNLGRWGSKLQYWNGEKFGSVDEAIITECLPDAEHILSQIDPQLIQSPNCFSGNHSVKVDTHYVS